MRKLWTPELDHWLLEQCDAARTLGYVPDFPAIAAAAGVSHDAIRMREVMLRRKLSLAPAPTNDNPPLAPPIAPVPEPAPFVAPVVTAPRTLNAKVKDVHDILELPPRPFEVARPMVPELRTKGKVRTAVVYTDTHFPFQDRQTLALIQRLVVDLRPDKVVHLGDLLDCYSISRFSTDPNRTHTLQSEIDLARVHLAQMRDLAPQAECWLLAGNHEDRLQKTIWNLPGGAAELARLTAFQKALEWPVLLELPAIHWTWVPSHKQAHLPIIPQLITRHGTVVRKWSGWSGKGEWEKYGKSGLSGHVHRMGSFTHRDLHGAHSWHEVGCSCSITPEYVTDPDWQNGCAVVSYTENWYQVEPVFILNGRAMFRGQEYQS